MADLHVAYLHHNRSPENVVFSLILLSCDPIPGFLPAYSRWRICVLTCITIVAPKMSSFSSSSCHVTPSPVFSRLIQDGGFDCLPASQSQPRKCRLFRNPLVTWPSPWLSPGWFKMADLRAYLHNNHSPDNVVFSLILLSRDPLPGFLPADSRWQICVLTCITITAPTMSSFP